MTNAEFGMHFSSQKMIFVLIVIFFIIFSFYVSVYSFMLPWPTARSKHHFYNLFLLFSSVLCIFLSPSSNILRRNIKTYLHWHTLIFQHFEFFHCNDAFVEHSNSLKSSNFFFSLILGFLRIFSFVEPLNYDMPW